jgi:hypothetical protein
MLDKLFRIGLRLLDEVFSIAFSFIDIAAAFFTCGLEEVIFPIMSVGAPETCCSGAVAVFVVPLPITVEPPAPSACDPCASAVGMVVTLLELVEVLPTSIDLFLATDALVTDRLESGLADALVVIFGCS